MTAKYEFPDTDNLISRYVGGESPHELAREKGVSYNVIARIMREAGVLRRKSDGKVSLDIDEIVSRYLSGESENAIAQSMNVRRDAIRRRLLKAGIEPRGRSEAELLKWSLMSDNQRRQQVSAAHDASRGRTVPHSQQVRMAQGRERTKSHAVAAEYELANLLRNRGYSVALQKAVDIYNIDIAIDSPPVAVEIFGGKWHAVGNHERRFFKRTKYFLNNGWHMIIVWVDGRRYPVGVACADYIAAFAQQLGSDVAGRGQYRVILGDGQDAPATDSYFNSPAVIKRLRSGR